MKNQRLVIRGEIGFKNEIDMFRYNSENKENIFYYPLEYLKENIENISLSFNIWSLGVVFLEILTQEKLFKNQIEIEDENDLKNIKLSKNYKEL